MINKNSKIFIAGHNGMVGSAICKKLINKGFKKIITATKKKLWTESPKKKLLDPGLNLLSQLIKTLLECLRLFQLKQKLTSKKWTFP